MIQLQKKLCDKTVCCLPSAW